jgi:hypothetical protein
MRRKEIGPRIAVIPIFAPKKHVIKFSGAYGLEMIITG